MTIKNQTSGRRASVVQREFAAEILKRFKMTGDIAILTHALEHFCKTGDFSPFSDRDQYLQKQAIFMRLKSKNLRGEALDTFIESTSHELGQSEATLKRRLKRGNDKNPTLSGVDALFTYLQILSDHKKS